MGSMAFAEKPGGAGATRYYFENGLKHNGDAVALSGMIYQYRPTCVIEIGSGSRSAVIVHAVDRLGLRDFHLTCIDPDASRLRDLLRPEDYTKMSVIEDKVQEVPIDAFDQPQAGDILLIDSSHVMKTGSDVHYELFSILPMLRPGVIIHFHDVHFPFDIRSRGYCDFVGHGMRLMSCALFLHTTVLSGYLLHGLVPQAASGLAMGS